MAGVGGANEEVGLDLEQGQEGLEARSVAIGQLSRADSLALGGQGHRLAVLVRPGQEEHVLPALAHVAGQDVRPDGGVGVPQVGGGVDVVDGGGDVEAHG